MNRRSIQWLLISLIFFTPMIAFAQTPLHPSPIKRQIPYRTYDVPGGEPYNELLKILAMVGYEDTIPSLLSALYDEHGVISLYALQLLQRFPDSPEVVAELNKAMGDDREGIVIHAAVILQQWGKTEWTEKAVERLPKLENRALQIYLSGTLARAGNTTGWQFIMSALLDREAKTDSSLVSVALNTMELFDGKIGPDGQKIDVLTTLSDLAEIASSEVRTQVAEKIDQIRLSRKSRQ